MSAFSYSGSEVQKLKTPVEVLDTKSGLCIEVSLLMAAAIENVGLNPVLILTHNHAWVGIELGYKSDEFVFLETTLLEGTPEEAIKAADENWKAVKDLPFGYKILRVKDLRAEGLKPITFERQ